MSAAGAATWLYQALDPDGQHELTIELANADSGEVVALLVHVPDPITGLVGGPRGT